MDKRLKRHLERRGVRFAKPRRADGLLGTNDGARAFFKWFHDGVMRFDSLEYRRQFWREACQYGHTIGPMPRTAIEFLDARRHPRGEWLSNLLFLLAMMGAATVVWVIIRQIDLHIRRLRRPTYYETERLRRASLAAARRQIRKRTTTNSCPSADDIRNAFANARQSAAHMIRFGSLLEDLECFVDNSIIWGGETGRIVGRHGGIRQWLRDNAPDLSARYKTMMRYKSLARKFRQAVGVGDPIPAAALLPDGATGKDAKNTRRNPAETAEATHLPNEMSRAIGRKRRILRAGTRANKGESENENTVRNNEIARVVLMAEAVRRAMAILKACEGTVESLAAQIALRISEDIIPIETNGKADDRAMRSRCGNDGTMRCGDDGGMGERDDGRVPRYGIAG